MSESTDDAQRKTSPEVVTTGAEAPPGIDPPSPDADDVEVLAQQPAEPSAPRHDSVVPTSRKLAPPPKPKRDSANPGSMPPSAGDALGNVGSLRAPAAPSISYHDASASSRDAVASALSGSESLRAIGEALSKDAGAFSATEAPTGGRPPVPRPRSQPDISLGSESPPQDTPATPAAKPAAIFAQRIIAVGTPSERPLPKPAPAPSRPDLDLDRTLQSEERPVEASPVAEHVQTAQPPLVAPLALELTPLPVVPAPIPELLPPAPPPPVELLPPAPPPPVELLPPAPPPPV
ncbi:MAG: hypothetical protein K0R38_6145, partial [Polyangiaceae bacterium]|nr:hypothetical protein [Polyangiaceae bacterium]